VRLLLFPIASAFLALRGPIGAIHAAAWVGLTASAIAILSVLSLQDAFTHDLDYQTGMGSGLSNSETNVLP
jgi:hypothetical protein